jgi:uncharacterized protein (DUF2141 family)
MRPMFYRLAVAAAFFTLATGSLSAASAADLTITVNSLRNSDGIVLLCVFSQESSDPAVFPDCKKGKPVREGKAAIKGGEVVFNYTGLKDGIYGVAVIHDENNNGELDTNFLGIPTEGIGISNNPKLLGKPTFSEAKFQLTGKMQITISAKYIL